MQNVTSDYKTAIRSIDKPYDEVYGTVTFSDNTTLSITPAIIPEKTCTISRQCIDGDDLEFGGVYSDQLEMQLITDKSRYAFFGARVVLDYKILVNGSYKVVHLGQFTISDAERQGDVIKFTAYDDMRLLDVPLLSDAVSGQPWDILSFISQTCDYPLSFTQASLSNFVNTTTNLYFDSTSGLKTYRDMLKAVCQNLGCSARDDRTGQMQLFKYNNIVVDELTAGDWYDITIADYECQYVALSVTSAKGTYTARLTGEQTGNYMKIPDAPAWDYGIDEVLQAQTNAIFSVISNLVYTPVEINTIDDPSFDVGDTIEITTIDGDTIQTIITSYEWTWGGGMTLVSKGVNPYMSGVSTSDIGSTRLLGKDQKASKFTYYTYVNGSAKSLTTTFKQLYHIRFVVGSTTTVTLWHEFKWLNELANENQEVTLNYYFDGTKFDYEPTHTYGEDGYHTWDTQFWLQEVEAGSTHEWEVWAKVNSGDCTINTGDLHALLQGQNLEPQDKFNGELEIYEEIEPFTFGLDTATFVDTPVISKIAVNPNITASDTFEPFTFGLEVAPLIDTQVLTAQTVQYTRVTEDGNTRVTEEGDVRLTEV